MEWGRGGRRPPGPSSDELIYQARKLKKKLSSSKKKFVKVKKKIKIIKLDLMHHPVGRVITLRTGCIILLAGWGTLRAGCTTLPQGATPCPHGCTTLWAGCLTLRILKSWQTRHPCGPYLIVPYMEHYSIYVKLKLRLGPVVGLGFNRIGVAFGSRVWVGLCWTGFRPAWRVELRSKLTISWDWSHPVGVGWFTMISKKVWLYDHWVWVWGECY